MKTAPGAAAAQSTRVDALLDGFVSSGFAAGVAAYAERRGEPLYDYRTGLADIASRRPIADDTVYRIYSMSKLFAATAGMILFERGLFRMEDPLSRFIPAFRNPQVHETGPDGRVYARPARREIRIRDLFTMASGIPWIGDATESERLMYGFFRGGNDISALTTVQIAESVARFPLDFDPGSRWKYGFSHDILGALVCVLSGRTFGEFLREEVFEPLGMEDTGFCLPAAKRGRLASTYPVRADGTIRPEPLSGRYPETPPAYESGGGGMVSTLPDYAAFARMLLTGRAPDGRHILGRKTLELLRADQLSAVQRTDFESGLQLGKSYALGVSILTDLGRTGCAGSVGEFGWAGAAGTWVTVDPGEDLFAVLMLQRMPGGLDESVPRFKEALYAML